MINMPKENIDALVSGGKATPAPPLGPALSPLGVNVVQVVKEINDKTAMFAGMEVPVKIVVDTDTKKFTVTVGTPPVTSMIKKEMKKEKLATVGEDKIRKSPGSITLEAVIKIAKSMNKINPILWNHSSTSFLEGFLLIASTAININLPPSSAGKGIIFKIARLKDSMAVNIIMRANPKSITSLVATAIATGPPKDPTPWP